MAPPNKELNLDQKMDLLLRKFAENEGKLDQLLGMKKQVEENSHEIAELKKQVVNLQQQNCYLQQRTRINNLEIVGFPVTKNENTDEIMMAIADSINCPMVLNDISKCHRVPCYNEKKGYNIVCQFISRRVKEDFLAKTKSFSKANQGFSAKDVKNFLPDVKIYVNEHLSPEKKRLFSEAKAAKKQFDWKFLWIKEGNVLARKDTNSNVVKIDCRSDIAKIH